jgi:SHS2 domain-containing protein
MSTDASTGAGEDDAEDLDPTNYDAMLDTLDVGIAEARRKVENGRVRSPENEKVRIKWIRALAYAVNVRRQVANDRDLQELAEEVEALKEQYEDDTDL